MLPCESSEPSNELFSRSFVSFPSKGRKESPLFVSLKIKIETDRKGKVLKKELEDGMSGHTHTPELIGQDLQFFILAHQIVAFLKFRFSELCLSRIDRYYPKKRRFNKIVW